MKVSIKRVYAPPSPSDGKRILVDRLWPRGIRKEELHADVWMRDIAPSNELRKWFNHDPRRWDDFVKRYAVELEENNELATLKALAVHSHITLLYAAKDTEHNNAAALAQFLRPR